MISFEQVGKRYTRGHDALADVSFTIRPGEFVVLSGHSGAGKSTLLKLLPLIERPSSGRVLINGQDIGALSGRAIPYLRRGMGLILQDHNLLNDRSIFANVRLPLTIAGLPAAEASRRAVAALERVGLGGREQDMPFTLSGGEQQRVAIARAVVNRPTILIADEPTAHLDRDYAQDIAALFSSFSAAGVTVLISTHDDSLFAPFAPRRLVLDRGRLVAGGEA